MASYRLAKVPSSAGRILYDEHLENANRSNETNDLARQMPGAAEVSTSAFGDQIIRGMTA